MPEFGKRTHIISEQEKKEVRICGSSFGNGYSKTESGKLSKQKRISEENQVKNNE